MKQEIERRKPQGFVDYLSLAITTVGVGYLPLPPGTWGSMVGVLLYLIVSRTSGFLYLFVPHLFVPTLGIDEWVPLQQVTALPPGFGAWIHAAIAILFLLLCLIGIWASGRSTSLFGNSDPSQAVIDEVMGQLMVFFFVPFGISWPFILAGFLLFRLFDIWKPYPIDDLQILPGGLGICADDIMAGVYAGICLAIGYAIYLWI